MKDDIEEDNTKSQEQIEVDVNGGHSIVLNSTVRALWTISRSPPAFSATAVPLALFDLAGEYLDCHSPPMPLATSTRPGGASKYHCNGPEAELAVEALTLFLSVHSQHPDAHYNLGVAYYTLTELDLAISCFVAALKVDPSHSMSMGALGTILTQQGKFEKAWELLDSRVRPHLSDDVDDGFTGDDVVPKDVSPSVVMAWARLAPRFHATQAAVNVLSGYIDYFHKETDPMNKVDEKVVDDEESNRHLSVEHPEGKEEQKKKKTVMSVSLRSRLEANLAFRLAQLLSHIPSLEDGEDMHLSWKETMRANQLATKAMKSEVEEGGGGKNMMSSSLALKQMSALRMAFCRECVHDKIPTSHKWRTLRSKSVGVSHPQDIRPIFVVGMPRSGTTLIEQMLGNHPQVKLYLFTSCISLYLKLCFYMLYFVLSSCVLSQHLISFS